MQTQVSHYLSKGFSLVPLGARSKIPPLKWKQYQSKRMTAEDLSAYIEAHPNCNLGVVTGLISGVIVLDIDSEAALVEARENGLPVTPTVRTKRGYQFYFKYRDGIRNFQKNASLRDMDLRAEGGLAVLPPSIHPSGSQYKWVEGCSLDDLEMAELPEWVIAGKQGNKEHIAVISGGVQEGGRNNALARMTGVWLKGGGNLETCLNVAKGWNQLNNPPMNDEEVERTVKSIYSRHVASEFEEPCSQAILPPEEINDFLKRDIPPVEFLVDQIVQRQGRTMISAAPNKGKSIFVQNIALAVTSTMKMLLHQFEAKKVRTLYLDFEMGESLVHDRFKKMLSDDLVSAQNLFIKCLLGKDILADDFKRNLERWIKDQEIGLLVIDPIGSAWCGDENNKEEVSKLTSYLDSLIDRFKISILFVHHWRKASQYQKTGSEMAAGSYKFNAWVDVHLTLDGEISCITLTCQKARATAKFFPMRIKLDPVRMSFEYIGRIEAKYSEETLIPIYLGMKREWVSIPELINECKSKNSAGKVTVRNLLKSPQLFEIDKTAKTHKIRLKPELVQSSQSLGLDDL